MQEEALREARDSLQALPARQREAFMLRNFEGMESPNRARHGLLGRQRQDASTRGRCISLRARLVRFGDERRDFGINRNSPKNAPARCSRWRRESRPAYALAAHAGAARGARGRRRCVGAPAMAHAYPVLGVGRRRHRCGGARRRTLVRGPVEPARSGVGRGRSIRSSRIWTFSLSDEESGDAMDMLQDDVDFYAWRTKPRAASRPHRASGIGWPSERFSGG